MPSPLRTVALAASVTVPLATMTASRTVITPPTACDVQALPSAAFLPVTERAVWVQQTPRSSGGGGGGGSSGGGGGDNQNCSGSGSAADDAVRPRLLWLNAAELRQVLGLELDGSCFLAAAGAPQSFYFVRSRCACVQHKAVLHAENSCA